MNTIDALLANKIIRQAQSEHEEPYSFELNKIRPKSVAPSFETPGNIADIPNVPEAVKPDVDHFISSLKKLQELEADIKTQQKMLQDLLAPKLDEKNELKTQLNDMAQVIGPKLQQIDTGRDTVLAKLNSMFIAASRVQETKITQTMTPEAQIEVLKGTMRQLNEHFADEVIARFEAALSQFKVANTVVKRTIRVFPATQEQMKGKAELKIAAIKILYGQISEDVVHLVQDIQDMITSGLSGLLETQNIIQDGIMAFNPKITKMEQPSEQKAANVQRITSKYLAD